MPLRFGLKIKIFFINLIKLKFYLSQKHICSCKIIFVFLKYKTNRKCDRFETDLRCLENLTSCESRFFEINSESLLIRFINDIQQKKGLNLPKIRKLLVHRYQFHRILFYPENLRRDRQNYFCDMSEKASSHYGTFVSP